MDHDYTEAEEEVVEEAEDAETEEEEADADELVHSDGGGGGYRWETRPMEPTLSASVAAASARGVLYEVEVVDRTHSSNGREEEEEEEDDDDDDEDEEEENEEGGAGSGGSDGGDGGDGHGAAPDSALAPSELMASSHAATRDSGGGWQMLKFTSLFCLFVLVDLSFKAHLICPNYI